MNTPQIPITVQTQRLFAAPQDPTSIWSSQVAAEAYAANNPTAYAGQTVAYMSGIEYILAVIQPDGALKVAGSCNCDGSATSNDLKFIVLAGETKTVNVIDPAKHKAVNINYIADSTMMGTLRLAGDTFVETDVTDDDDYDIEFSRAGNAVSVRNGTATDIEVIFKFNYFSI